MMFTDSSALNYEELDLLAWKVIRDWPALSKIDAFKDGLNFHELSSWFLWDKTRTAVMRAGRKETLAAEIATLSKPLSRNHVPSVKAGRESLFQRLQKHLQSNRSVVAPSPPFQPSGKRLLYVPIVSDRLISTVQRLLQKGACQVVSHHAPSRYVNNLSFIGKNFTCKPDFDFAEYLLNGIREGFRQYDLALDEADLDKLKSQLASLTLTAVLVEQEMTYLKPDAVLVHGDNHPPHQVYVMVARKLNIPSIMLQHGLDCEHHYLDEGYASAIAVWGEERERRYRQKSSLQPFIRVTGNPEFDSLRLPEAIDSCGDYWLWLTRPHTPEKCYAPSRSPMEGLKIFDVLMKALAHHPEAKLLIKAHPYDYSDRYLELMTQSEHAARMQISEKNIPELISSAAVVITEDTTSGMEAMFLGRPLVHAHFASSPPSMPFVEYGAALPGFSENQLMESLNLINKMTREEQQQFHEGQINFLTDFAGPCDGRATERVIRFIEDVLQVGERDSS